MRIEVNTHALITLHPENDSDRALLAYWSKKSVFIASSSYSEGQTTRLLIQFLDTIKLSSEDDK